MHRIRFLENPIQSGLPPILLGHSQWREQGLRVGGGGRFLLGSLRQGLNLEDADHRMRPALRVGPTVLRRTRCRGRRGADRQLPRVLRADRVA